MDFAYYLVFGAYVLFTPLLNRPRIRSRSHLAWREPDYGPLQILRCTTGAMLLYFGGMSITL